MSVLELASELIRRRSVTPDDAGCQDLIAERLAAVGFHAERLDADGVSNILLTRGSGSPSLWFVGHTDVVPPGPEDAWNSPPFEPQVRDGLLFGRGAADMKGSVAAMVIACEAWAAEAGDRQGQLGLLLTSDEEGPAEHGIRHVANVLRERGQHPDFCLVGEPSSTARLGDQLRIGRRGSVHARLTVKGLQGHTAFPEHLDNPVHRLAPFIADLANQHWDDGDDDFPPTHVQVSNIHAGTGAENVTPGAVELWFNFRNGPASPAMHLRSRVEALLDRHDIRNFKLDWHVSGEPFRSRPGALREAVCAVIEEHLGVTPDCNTGGGTSDGRFMAPLGAEVVEFGPVNASIHQVDEHVAATDLEALALAYAAIVRSVLRPA